MTSCQPGYNLSLGLSANCGTDLLLPAIIWQADGETSNFLQRLLSVSSHGSA